LAGPAIVCQAEGQLWPDDGMDGATTARPPQSGGGKHGERYEKAGSEKKIILEISYLAGRAGD
jgi:hypothetical protein